jgi:hypothetical protein
MNTLHFEEIATIGLQNNNSKALISEPMDIAVDHLGDIYVLEKGEGINKFDTNGKYLFSIGKKGRGPGEILFGKDIDIDSQGNILVMDVGTNRITKYTSMGNLINTYSLNDINITSPVSLALDSKDNMYVYGYSEDKLIHKLDSEGNIITSFMNKIPEDNKRIEPHINMLGNMNITREDKIYLTMISPYKVYIFDTEGNKQKEFVPKVDYSYKPKVYPSNDVITPFAITDIDFLANGDLFVSMINLKAPESENKLQKIISDLYAKYVYIDYFNNNGDLMEHRNIPNYSGIGTFDEEGYYYMVYTAPSPHIVKCKISIK